MSVQARTPWSICLCIKLIDHSVFSGLLCTVLLRHSRVRSCLAMAVTPAPSDPVVLDLMDSYGPMLIGSLFAAALWGISTMQLFLYHLNCGDDPILLKAFVYAMWLLETASEMLTFSSLWPVLILKWGSVRQFSTVSVPALHRLWVVSIVTVAVQIFYLHRIYRFSGNRALIPLLLSPFIIWQFIEPFMFLGWILEDLNYSTLLTKRTRGLELSLWSCNILVDIAIMIGMVILLLRQRHSEYRRSHKLIGRLMVMVVNTGLCTTVVAILDLILVLVFPDGIQYCALEFPLGSLYVNALLANLNCREFVRKSEVDWDSLQLRTAPQEIRRLSHHAPKATSANSSTEDVSRVFELGKAEIRVVKNALGTF
ncbi:hypothetical protein GY45DRAFT_218107 [Cubamyces sp. BRFM 1775]|nr:hypothetical protein GY45DRAFT_218107 [Cubamyces sp. BRFM 1775]